MQFKEIAIIGGTGFVGRHLCNALSRSGLAIRVLTRKRERNRHLLVFPRLSLIQADVHDQDALAGALAGADAVIHLAAILNEQGTDSFTRTHVQLTENVTHACQANDISRLLYMSALGASVNAPSEYLKSKAKAEEQAHSLDGLHTTSFRPSVIFGPADDFFNRFARLLAMSPGIFPLACPTAQFAPVYVEDVVAAMLASLQNPSTFGQRYDLCGPETYSLRELVEYTAQVANLRRKIIPLSDRLSALQARILEKLPGKPFSMDNYLSTKADTSVSNDGFAQLGIAPRSIESIVPSYLGNEERNSKLSSLRKFAGRS